MDPTDIDVQLFLKAARKGAGNYVRAFLNDGMDPNVQDIAGWTALKFAATDGNLRLVELLLDRGADPNIQNNQGKTALMLASRNGHTEIEEILRNAAVEGCPAKDNEIQLCDNNMTPRQKKRVYSSPERRERLIRDSHSPPPFLRGPGPSSPERRERLIRDAHSPPPFLRGPGPSSPERRERLIRDAGRSLRESLDRDRQMRGLGRSIYDPTN